MANRIVLKRSSVALKVPLAGDLVAGELAVNLTDKVLYTKDASGNVVPLGGSGGGSGTVTGVTATAPVVSTGGAAPVISMAAANTSTPGYLTAADWNTFNGKQAALGFTPYNSSNPSGFTSNTGSVTSVAGTGTVSGLTLSGTVTASGNLTLGGTLSLTSGNVTTALGYTPYNSSNPSGYITSSSLSSYLPLSGGTLTGPLEISTGSTNNSFNEGLRLTAAGNGWAGVTFASTGLSGAPVNGWFAARNPSYQFMISPSSDGSLGLLLNNAGNALWRNNVILHAGNYTSYSPSLTGSGASGTWGINVTGSSASCSGNAATATTLATNGAVSFSTNNSGIFVAGTEGTGSTVRLGSAWSRPGIYNGSGTTSGGNSNSITIGSEDSIYFVTQNNERGRYDNSGNGFATSSFRAPIFYDQNNTGFYGDFASGSNMNTVNATRFSAPNNGIISIGDDSATNTYSDGSTRSRLYVSSQYPVVTINSTVQGGNGNHGPTLQFSTNGYDSGRHWVIGTGGTGQALDFGTAQAGNRNPHEGIAGYSGSTPMRITVGSNVGIGGSWGPYGLVTDPSYRLHVQGTGYASSDFRAPQFFDSNDTSYYLDPNGTSELSTLTAATRTRWDMPRRTFNRQAYTGGTGYWTGTRGWGGTFNWNQAWGYGFGGFDIWGENTQHPQGNGYIHAQGICSGLHHVNDDGGAAYGFQLVGGTNASDRLWYRGAWGNSGNNWREIPMFDVNSGNGSWMWFAGWYDNNNSGYYVDPNGTSRMGTINADALNSYGNVIAYYSDERLKTIKGPILNAVEKLSQIDGFYYTGNETAKSLGYDTEKVQLGVSAQKVGLIFPELIERAPCSDKVNGVEYKTLDYSKLVPVLIEAIKEQQTQIEELRNLINSR